MRKTSSYARKVRNNLGMYQGGAYNGATFLNTIQRCRPYMDEPIIGSNLTGTQDACEKAMILVRDAFVSIKSGQSPADDTRSFDILAHALGVTTLRAIDIAGQDEFENPMLPITRLGNDALERCRVRYLSLGRWGFDGPAIDQIDAAIELYETILQASSPAQMEEATVRRIEILAAQRKSE